MDPNEALKELIRLADRIMDDHWLDAQEQEEFAAHFQALDDWIRSGGFLPTAWHLPKPVVVREPTIKGMYDSVTGRPATIFTPPENLIPAPVPPLVLPDEDREGDKPVTQPIAYYLRLAERITHDRDERCATSERRHADGRACQRNARRTEGNHQGGLGWLL